MTSGHPEQVAEYLEHVLEAIERASAHISDVLDAAAFEKDAKSQDAVVRNIEIIGEAAGKIAKVAPDFITQHPNIPWQQIRGMRNRIIHDYFEVDYGVVWQTVKNDLPLLAGKLRALLPLPPK